MWADAWWFDAGEPGCGGSSGFGGEKPGNEICGCRSLRLRAGLSWAFDDLRIDVGFFEVAVLCGDGDLAAIKEEEFDLEFGPKAGGEPCAVSLRGVDDREAEAGDVGSQERANSKGNVACHGCSDQDGLESSRVNVGFTLPAEIGSVFGAKADVEDIAAVHALPANQNEVFVDLLARREGEEIVGDTVFGSGGIVVREVVAHAFDEAAVGIVVPEVEFEIGALVVALLFWEVSVGDVPALVEEAAVECQELLMGALSEGCDPRVGDLSAHDCFALVRGDAGVLDVGVVGALGFGSVLMGGYELHDGGGREWKFCCPDRLLRDANEAR